VRPQLQSVGPAEVRSLYPAKSCAFWSRMLRTSALLLFAALLNFFQKFFDLTGHQLLLADELFDCAAKVLGWMVLPLYVSYTQLGVITDNNRNDNDDVPEVIVELEELESYTIQHRPSSASLQSEL
jgi:hypothetical protein